MDVEAEESVFEGHDRSFLFAGVFEGLHLVAGFAVDFDGFFAAHAETVLDSVDHHAHFVHVVTHDVGAVALVVENGGEEDGLVDGRAAAGLPGDVRGRVDVTEVRGMDVVEVDVVDHEVACGGNVLAFVCGGHCLTHSVSSTSERFLVEDRGMLGSAVVKVQSGYDVSGHIGLARCLRHINQGIG